MDTIQKHVRQAYRRILLEQFVRRVIVCTLATLGMAVVAIAIPKLFVMDRLPANWAVLWLGGALIAAWVAAGIWTLIWHRNPLDAALEIDRRCGLKERVSSSLALSALDANTRAGRALVADATRRVERIDIGGQFPIRLGRRPWTPLIPALIAVCLIAWVDDRTRPAQANSNNPQWGQQLRKRVQTSAEILRKKIDQKKKEAVAKGLKDAEGLFRDLEKGTRELAQKEGADRKQAAIKLNDLAKQIEERRSQLGGKENLRKQFEQLKNIEQGPAEKIAKALNEGDMKQAVDALNQLQEKIAEGGLGEEDQKKLAEQLGAMQEKIQAAVAAQNKAIEDLQQQIENQKRLGNTQNAASLQEQLDRMAQNQAQMDQLKKLAAQFGQCQNCMQQGDQAGAQQAMGQLAQQLETMQQQLEEMEMLGDALQQIGDAKNAMGCQQCGGKGCKNCQGGMLGMGQGQGMGRNGGMGMGQGQGRGPRPEEEDNLAFRDSQVRQNTNRGRAVITGTADGPNIKGSTGEAILQEMTNEVREAADPLTLERLPRSRREHVIEYNNLIREGD